jgi:uncharacterized membrane protein
VADVAVRDGRVVGLDVARCLALLGMVATHVLLDRGVDGDVSAAQWLAGGRASALFAVLAGASLALMTGGRRAVAGRELTGRRAGLVVRALLIALLGLALGELESGLAVILTYYGVLFLLGLPFLGLRARTLLVLAAVWAVLAPVLSQLLRPHLPERGFASPSFHQLAEPGHLVSELLLTGYYPCVPWLTFLLVGLAVGRMDLRRGAVQASLAGVGLVLAVAATLVSHWLTARDAVAQALLADAAPGIRTGPELLDSIATGMYGNTPTGGSWAWLLVVASHSSTPFDLAQTTGSALLVIGLCVGIVGLWGSTVERGFAVFFGAGTMTLSLYSLHAVARTDAVWPPETPESFRWHVLVLLAIGAVVVAMRRRGPLETVVRGCAEAAAASLRRTPRALDAGTGR